MWRSFEYFLVDISLELIQHVGSFLIDVLFVDGTSNVDSL